MYQFEFETQKFPRNYVEINSFVYSNNFDLIYITGGREFMPQRRIFVAFQTPCKRNVRTPD
jgi:hypothetical protein